MENENKNNEVENMSQQAADELVAKFAKAFEESNETFKKFNEQLNELLKQQTKLLADRQRKTLAEKRVIREMWGRKAVTAKWYNKWYYTLKFKASVKDYFLCAGELYFIENELCNLGESASEIMDRVKGNVNEDKCSNAL